MKKIFDWILCLFTNYWWKQKLVIICFLVIFVVTSSSHQSLFTALRTRVALLFFDWGHNVIIPRKVLSCLVNKSPSSSAVLLVLWVPSWTLVTGFGVQVHMSSFFSCLKVKKVNAACLRFALTRSRNNYVLMLQM